jgi:hypothetical protein
VLKTIAKVTIYAVSIAMLIIGLEVNPVGIVVGILGLGIWLGMTMFKMDLKSLDSSNALVYPSQPTMKPLPAPKTPQLEWIIEDVPEESKSA